MTTDHLARTYDHHAEQARAFLEAAEKLTDPTDALLVAQVHAQLATGVAVLMAGDGITTELADITTELTVLSPR